MAIQSTPHTESQQNKNESETELDPNQIAERLEQEGSDGLYAHMEGAQTGMNRSEHVTDGRGEKHKVEPSTSAYTGATSSAVGDAETQGISNHSQKAEHDGQVKVMQGREQSTSASPGEAESGEPVRDSVHDGGALATKKEEKVETVEISGGRAIR